MNLKLYAPVYALTLLLSAALLFSVQPMFSKMILPLLGGTPQVWNTAMLFFQLMLLAGYAYAHITTKLLNVQVQGIVHIGLLLFFTIFLPLAIPEGWVPSPDVDPSLWQLGVMSATVGGPFFILAGSAPMLQRWFCHTNHPDAENPYFLYGASNLGSMTSLLAYPVVIEPLLNLSEQSHTWALGYFILIACTAASFSLIWNKNAPLKTNVRSPANDEAVSWPMRFQWLLLAFIPSSLMLGVTTYITTDIASVPLLWILPLALYLGTFIIVFARHRIISKKRVFFIHGLLLLALIAQMPALNLGIFGLIGINIALFFFSALSCHMELADSRPHARHLTEFFLIMSIGGALGGFFNAIIAPNLFIIAVEYPIALAAAAFMRYSGRKENIFSNPNNLYIFGGAMLCAFICFQFPQSPVTGLFIFALIGALSYFLETRYLFAIGVSVCLLLNPPGHEWGSGLFKEMIHQDRNFFGVIKIIDTFEGERILLNGTTNHGMQAQEEEYRLTPLAYYGGNSPLSDVINIYNARPGKQDVGVIGLGVGVVACFQKDARHFDFFEIDPNVIDIAQNPEYFTFMSDCGSSYDIIQGDGRLTIDNKPDGYYDIIILDAFSSDNIPVHVLTLEALEIYFSKLKEDGIIAMNISNKYLDIEPILSKAAEEMGVYGYAHASNGDDIEGTDLMIYPAHFFAMTKNKKHIQALEKDGWTTGKFRKGVHLWTDQYSNIISVLGLQVAVDRMKDAINKEKAEDDNKAE